MSNLDVNAKFVIPTLVGELQNIATKQSDEVLKSRLETLALLLQHVENTKMWDAIIPFNAKREGR